LRLVVDANVLVALAVPTAASARATELVDEWLTSEVALFAPSLWSYEAVSAIRKFVASGGLSQEGAFTAVAHLLSIEIQDVPATEDLHRKALIWAARFNDFVAYDPAYLALAEHLEAPFWTADSKLARKARALGIDWVHDLVGDIGESPL
jgi:predicted nucleic acid-binding protein